MQLPGIFRGLLAAIALVSFSAHAALSEDKPLRIGVTAGPHAQIFDFVKKIAEKDGLKLQIVEFSDYVQPNAALAAGDLDVNSYQHQPYLDNANKDRGLARFHRPDDHFPDRTVLEEIQVARPDPQRCAACLA